MILASDLINIKLIRPEFHHHLPVVVVHDGERYTSTHYQQKLFNKPNLVRQIQEEILHKRMMDNQKTPEGDDDATKQTEKWRNT